MNKCTCMTTLGPLPPPTLIDVQRLGLNSASTRRRVYKSRYDLAFPWIATGQPFGPQSFKTWREAMNYANARINYTLN